MNRRNFLSLFSAGVAGLALEQAIPLGRVWSLPKKIVIAKGNQFITPEQYEREFHLSLHRNLAFYYSYAAIRSNGWRFPTAAFPPDNSRNSS